MEFRIRPAGAADISLIRSMADVVFRATYADILSPEQMEYMMDWMYSPESLMVQTEGEGRWFFIAEADGQPAGYVSYEFEDMLEDGRKLYHLQKLYAMPQYQGKGLGRRMLLFVEEALGEANPYGCRIELNVNRANSAVDFYEHIGLTRDRQGDFPIGHGYFMNDYIYAIDIKPTEIQ
ncbi:MAG: GNAT family N-acetyltransferase [Bacteroidia bacterium]|nr:GNAT family N-acetyltransferase [Bacteroidia bacterium]